MKRMDIVKKNNLWVAESGGQLLAKAKTKEAIIHKTAQVARKMPEAVTVKIHKVDNKIQEERTYPRSADPHKSKG